MTEGEFHGKVNSENPSSNGRFKDILADGYVDQAELEKDPAAFKHVSINEMADFLQSIGYQTIIMDSSHLKSNAPKIAIGNANHRMNIKQVQFSPGGGQHGPNPYIKFSTNGPGIIKIVFGNPKTYISYNEKAKIIFVEEDYND